MINFVVQIDCDNLEADIISEKDAARLKKKLGKYQLGVVQVDQYDASHFLDSISGYEIGGVQVSWALEQIVSQAYMLGFKHGETGLPAHILKDPANLPIIRNDPNRPQD